MTVARRRRGAIAAGLGWALVCSVPACSLEDALGVSDDGSSGPATAGPGGGSADADGTQGSTALDTAAETTAGDPADSTETGLPPASCGGRSLRVATFNIESVDAEGSTSFEALASVVQRIDADVVCLQEVELWETSALFALAAQTGYPDVIQAQEPPAIGGDLTNACMSRGALRLVGSYSGWDLSSDRDANDVGRDILVVAVDLGEPGDPPCEVGLVTLHLKSGQDPLDWFRRQIEAERVAQAVGLLQAELPGAPVVLMGDLNENLGDPALGSVFTGAPEGLPPSYRVGSDISFPLTYQPFATFEALGLSIVPATQEDSVRDETWNDAVRLDYIMQAGAQLQGAEVYSSCRDNGADDPPAGQWLPKAGDPLDCGVSDEASDHFPVFADLVLP